MSDHGTTLLQDITTKKPAERDNSTSVTATFVDKSLRWDWETGSTASIDFKAGYSQSIASQARRLLSLTTKTGVTMHSTITIMNPPMMTPKASVERVGVLGVLAGFDVTEEAEDEILVLSAFEMSITGNICRFGDVERAWLRGLSGWFCVGIGLVMIYEERGMLTSTKRMKAWMKGGK
ncbi:hypothetical protein MJO29_015242 [Puccinia striiformis f. sp. tritici]|nr:hypothetical protein MJO29_015242 [Puccinia striiformis f. sp. tritici]